MRFKCIRENIIREDNDNSDNETQINIEKNSDTNADDTSNSKINYVECIAENNARNDSGSTKNEMV